MFGAAGLHDEVFPVLGALGRKLHKDPHVESTTTSRFTSPDDCQGPSVWVYASGSVVVLVVLGSQCRHRRCLVHAH